MAFTPHPDFGNISGEIAKLIHLAKPLDTIGYRSTSTDYANENDIVSGIGSQLYGGRWNVKGSFPTIYLCSTPEIALAESLAFSRRMKIPDHAKLPQVVVGVKLIISKSLDLTCVEAIHIVNPLLAKALSWDDPKLTHESTSQAIGRSAKEACMTGLLVSSNVDIKVFNYVIFREKIDRSDILKVTPSGKLPKTR